VQLEFSAVLLQWATGGLLFLWVTTRRREVGIGYGWLLRGTYLTLALGAVVTALLVGPSGSANGLVIAGSLGCALGAVVALVPSITRRKQGVAALDPRLDLLAPVLGVIGLLGAASQAGDPYALSLVRMITGALFLGVVSDAMLLGHWYLVQPGLPRDAIKQLVIAIAVVWPFEVAAYLWPVGMVQVLDGTFDDGWGGLLGWTWVVSALTTIVLAGVTWQALKERSYSAVMAATGLLYLAILTGFGTDLVARAVLAS
jgi:hypothetical protein